MSERARPRISVVTPTYNRRDRLERVLSALAAQDVDEPFEVIVVSDGSTDGTNEYLQSDSVPLPVEPVLQENAGPAVARNAAIERARGDLIVFVDDDVVPEPGLLRAHRDAHDRLGERAVVIGPMLDPPDHTMSPWVAWEQSMLSKQYADMTAGRYHATARQFYTGNASVPRVSLLEAGCFDATYKRAEDVELAFRLNDLELEFHFEPTARGHHYAERPYASWKRAAHVYGSSEVRFARERSEGWMIDFTRTSLRRAHRVIRMLVPRVVVSTRWRRSALALCDALVRTPGAPRTAKRYALSLVYAIEFHIGVATELGSAAEYQRVILAGEPLDA